MPSRIMKVLNISPETRNLSVTRQFPVTTGSVIQIPVPSDDELCLPFSNWRERFYELEIEFDVVNGQETNYRLAQKYFTTKLDVAEGNTVEFKTSLFVAPEEQGPTGEQLKTIAKTIASFMNKDGGELYFGVDDSGRVRGLENDYRILGRGGNGVIVDTTQFSDSSFTYSGNADAYSRKIHALVQGYLSVGAESYLGDCIELQGRNNLSYIKLSIHPASFDKVVYFNDQQCADAIYVRNGAAKRSLKGQERDLFIREREKQQISEIWNRIRDTDGRNIEAITSKLDELLSTRVLQGARVKVVGAQPLTKEAIDAIRSPRSVAYNGEHLSDVGSWDDVFKVIFQKLNEINPQGFDALPDKYTNKGTQWFARGLYNHGYYNLRFGTNADVRARICAHKFYLYRESGFFCEALNACGVDRSSFSVTPRNR